MFSPTFRITAAITKALKEIEARRRHLLELFRERDTATSAEIAAYLGLSQRPVVALCRAWLADGFLDLADPSRKNRAYRIGATYVTLLEMHRPR